MAGRVHPADPRFFLLLTVGALEVSRWPGFCATCHEIRPEYMTWKVSTHQKVACTNCHYVPGADGKRPSLIGGELLALKRVYQQVFGKYLLPIELKAPIPNAACLGCHSPNRNPTPRRTDITIPHDKHLAQGLHCSYCHAGVVHGRISEREKTLNGDFDRWTPELARSQLVPPFTTLRMANCLDCHKARGVPTRCGACHTTIHKPKSHQTPTWVPGDHGRAALGSIDECDRCHSITAEPLQIRAETIAASYSRSNAFCYGCHQGKPPGHAGNWRLRHGSTPKNGNKGCFTCHDSTRGSAGDRANQVYCTQCHRQMHPNGPPSNHPVPVVRGQGPSSQCYNCHIEQTCVQCH